MHGIEFMEEGIAGISNYNVYSVSREREVEVE
jgi:hypothetical protein